MILLDALRKGDINLTENLIQLSVIMILRKSKIYKVKTQIKQFKRDYILFALPKDVECEKKMNVYTTIFLIDLNGNFSTSIGMGFQGGDTFVPLTLGDWLEVLHFLKGTGLEVNMKTKEVINVSLKKWGATEI